MIKITTCGSCVDSGKPTQRGGCAAHLWAKDSLGRVSTRKLTHAAGNSTQPQANLKAALLGLMSINAAMRVQDTELCVIPYVEQQLQQQDGKYKTTPKKNVELVDRLRSAVALFPRLRTLVADKSTLRQILEDARQCAEKQNETDTGTIQP
jgi:hypothetical protein